MVFYTQHILCKINNQNQGCDKYVVIGSKYHIYTEKYITICLHTIGLRLCKLIQRGSKC